MTANQVSPTPKVLSKMQRVRKRELRRAIQKLHERTHVAKAEPDDTLQVAVIYGLRVAITILGEMRKEIDRE